MRLICLTGIDGSGKTTLARDLARALNDRHVPASSIYGRTYPVVSRLLIFLGRLTALHGADPWGDYGAYTGRKKRIMRSRVLASIYTAAVLLDYYIQIWAKLLPYLFTSRIVVADRYVYDTVISDLSVHLDYSASKMQATVERVLKLLPTPDLAVLLDVPVEIAFGRKDDVPDLEYLRERQVFYHMLADRPEVVLLDGRVPTGELVQKVIRPIIGSPAIPAADALQ